MDKNLFFYELEGRGYTFENMTWLGNCFEDDMLNMAWEMWSSAKHSVKAQAVPEGFVLVPKSEIGHYYYDESEGMYIDEPDHFLTDLDIGEAQEVKCRDYFDLPSKYAAKIWDENNQDVGTWGIFDTEAEANNVAAHCKAMIEAQEQSHE